MLLRGVYINYEVIFNRVEVHRRAASKFFFPKWGLLSQKAPCFKAASLSHHLTREQTEIVMQKNQKKHGVP